jgi:putative hydrolase of the HAD superfamily
MTRNEALFAARPIVIFDAGGTLITLDHPRILRLLAPVGLCPTVEELEGAEARARLWADDAVRAELDQRQLWDGYFGRMLADIGAPEEAVPGLLEALWRTHRDRGLWTRPIEGVLPVLERLRGAGRRMAVVSNAEGTVERDLRDVGFGPFFETVVDSHLVGVAKPDPRIFRIVLEQLGADPSEALYVGDVPAYDLAGARAAGLPCVLIDPHGLHGHLGAPCVRHLSELLPLVGVDREDRSTFAGGPL